MQGLSQTKTAYVASLKLEFIYQGVFFKPVEGSRNSWEREVRIVGVDLYTKIVLTVIAASLVFFAFKSSFSPREATAQGVQRVYVEGGYLEVDGRVEVVAIVSVGDVAAVYVVHALSVVEGV